MSDDLNWVPVCAVDDIAEEGVIPFDFGRDSFCVYRTKSGFFATDGYCTHEAALLSDGAVIGEEIECPLHQGRFDIKSGKALSPPVSEALRTYPTRVEGGKVLIGLKPRK